MNVKLLFGICLAQATDVVTRVEPSQFDQPTPDTEWDVRQLAGHMLSELSWLPDLLTGQTVEAVGTKYDGDLIGSDLAGNWQTRADLASAMVAGVKLDQIVHLSYGNFPAEHYIHEQANDQLIHAWDLGTAIGVDVKFDQAVATELYRAAWPRRDQLAASGLFAPALSVPDSADIQTKLLALFGRRAQ